MHFIKQDTPPPPPSSLPEFAPAGPPGGNSIAAPAAPPGSLEATIPDPPLGHRLSLLLCFRVTSTVSAQCWEVTCLLQATFRLSTLSSRRARPWLLNSNIPSAFS